jgi:hypothetical protein
MSTLHVPADPAIYHITHIDNLPGILREGGLWCDAQRIKKNLATTNIGYVHIKQRRLARKVTTRADGMLGEYVPFNFCSRSVMLCAIYRAHDDYNGGQESVLHLVSSVSKATSLGRPWAFSDRHAELGHALHYDDWAHADEVQWAVMNLTWWNNVKEERQAEFLVHDFLPWTAVLGIGVMTPAMGGRAQQVLKGAAHQPAVAVHRDWYY